ncbi:tape measure protein [Dietzia aurantiaca]|nr:tape measure protein [Dietzia aurantiaca]
MTSAMSDISSTSAGAEGAVGGIGGALGGLSKKAIPVAAGLAGVAGAGATLQAGFGKLTSIEDTTASLGIILDDAVAAQDLMAQLQADNQATPYMFDAYAAAGKTLAAFGADLEGIPQQVSALGEAAAASGGGQEVFDQMARASGQAMATGKMSLDTINQLAVGGVQGLQILANHFDVPTDEMQKMISAGMVPAQEAMDILTQGILEGSDGIAGSTNAMSGVMQEMSETTSGSMTSLLAAFNNLAAAGIEPLVPIITMIADGLTDFAYVIIDLINGEADLPGWLQTVLQVLEPIAWIAGGVTTAFVAMKVASLALAGAQKLVALATGGISKAFGLLMAHPIIAAIAAITGGLIWFFTQTETGKKIWQGLMDALGAAWEWLQGAFAGVWSTISDAAVAAFEWISDAWNTMWSFLQSAWDTVGQPIINFIVAAFNLWWEGVQLYFRLLGAAWEVLWTGLGMAWDAVGQPVVDFIVAAFQMWWDGIKVIFSWLQAGWDLLWAGVKAVYDTVIAPVVRWVVDRFNDLKAGVGAALDLVKSAVQSVADRVAEFYGTYVQPMVDRVIRGFDRIRDTLTGWKDRIIGIFSGAGSWLWDAGKNIVQGLIDGIKSLAGTIGNAFLNTIPGWIKDPFKRALGIASPSKLFADYGRNIGEGLISGIKGMQGQVAASMGGLTSTAAAAGEELRDAFHGGDSGYAALGSVIGDQLAQQAMDVTAGAGQVAAPVVAAGDEVGAAFQGRDMGYAATGALIGDDAAMQALDVSAQIGDAFAAAGAGIDAAKTGIIDPALAGMSGNLASLGAAAAVQGTAITTALNTAGAGVANAKTTLVDPALAGMQAGLAQTALTTQQQMVGLALPAMQNAGSGIAAVQTGTVDPALAGMRGAIGNTATATAVGAANINAEWNKVREGTAAPVRFTIGSVFNDGLVGMWNGVADMIGAKKMNPYPVRFASGTSHIGSVLPGYTPGVDPYTFVEPRTGMTIGLGGGEGIARPEVVRALGPDRFDGLNAAARMGGVNAVRKHLGQFADGGVIGSITGLVNKYFPGMTITSTRRNSNDYHGQGLAVDFSNGTDTTPQMQAAARFFHQNYAAGLLELIHWPLNGWQNIKNGAPLDYGATTNAQHRNHVHVAAARPLPEPGGLVIPVPSGAGAAPIDWAAMVGEMIKPQADEIRGRIGGSQFPGIVGDVPGKTFESMLKPMQATITKKMEESGGSTGGGGGAEQWRGLAMQALARHGYNPAQHIDAMLKQIQIESGGVPNAINNWDSNAAKGTPSGGLLQVIEPTYRRVRNAYPEAFVGLPDNHMIPATNLVAGVGAVRMDWGGPAGRWPTTAGYDNGGVAFGEGFLAKKIVDPERVLNPAQTKAFEAWMAAGQRFDEINDLVTSVQAMQLDSPEVMADDIGRRVAQWIGDEPADGSLRALAAALQSGVEWERVTQGMARSAEAWANGDWVRVADDKRLATPDEMRRQVEGNFLSELADEFGGLIGLKGLLPAPDIVGETGLVTLPKETADKLDAAVSTPEGLAGGEDLTKVTRIATDTDTTTGGGSNTDGEKVIQVDMTINVNGATDPMAVSNRVVSEISRGLESAIGGQVRST